MSIRESAASDVPESSNYTTVYQLNIPVDGKFNDEEIPYSIDESENINFTFDRIAYHLEIQKTGEDRIWVFVSLPSLTMDASKIGIPTESSGGEFKQLVDDVQIQSNHPDLENLGTIDTGVIEFWGNNYGTSNGNSVPNADSSKYDFGDLQSDSNPGYGSMQIHDYESGQTIFAYNSWGYASGNGNDDLGIGNNPDSEGHPDWTFARNSQDYEIKTLTVMVHPGETPSELMINLDSPDSHQIVQRNDYSIGTFPIEGSTVHTIDSIEGRYTSLDNGTPSDWEFITTPVNSKFYGTLEVPTGWHKLDFRFMNEGQVIDSITVEPVGVGEVFIVSGQSNSANHGEYPLAPENPRISNWGPSGWNFAQDPQPAATGSGGSPWPVLGDLLYNRYNVPIGFLSVGYGGTKVDLWTPEENYLFPRISAALDEVQPSGARAILWHQGESNAGGTTAEDYAEMLSSVVLGTRSYSNDDIAWIVARVSFVPNGDPVKMSWVVEGQNTVIDNDPLTFAGPHTDDLNGSEWRYDTIHFNEAGLREHASRWDARIAAAMDELLVLIYDNDSDGVYDNIDLCLETPNDVDVFTDGCSEEQREIGSTTDSDNDGIMDSDDNCSDTPLNVPVFPNGCSESQQLSGQEETNQTIDNDTIDDSIILGCTYVNATNFDSNATSDDGTCNFVITVDQNNLSENENNSNYVEEMSSNDSNNFDNVIIVVLSILILIVLFTLWKNRELTTGGFQSSQADNELEQETYNCTECGLMMSSQKEYCDNCGAFNQ